LLEEEGDSILEEDSGGGSILEDEERGGLESEDLSGSILDEDDFGITPPDDISISAEEIGCSAPEDSGTFDSDESCDSNADDIFKPIESPPRLGEL
jgi:hypothetical protein